MTRVRLRTGETGTARLGAGLVGVALLGVVVAYLPPGSGVPALLAERNVFLPIAVSLVGLALSPRRLVRISLPALVVAVPAAYLAVVPGFGPRAPFVAGPVVLAVLVGVRDGVVGPGLDSER